MRYLSLLILLCGPSLGRGETIVLPPELCLHIPQAEQRLLDDLADGRLDEHNVLSASLIAAGAEESLVATCQHSVDRRVQAWTAAGVRDLAPQRRSETLFALMHQELLRGGYESDASSLAEAIEHGRFNCVSATLLWQYVSAEFGIESVAQQLPGHMQSVTMIDGRKWLIETTCPTWQSTDSSDSAVGRALNDAQLMACVYYNRGLRLMAEGDFAAALTATYTAHRLDPENTAARGNLLATLNNWALRLAEQGQHARAVWLLETGEQLAPEHNSFGLNLKLLRAAK